MYHRLSLQVGSYEAGNLRKLTQPKNHPTWAYPAQTQANLTLPSPDPGQLGAYPGETQANLTLPSPDPGQLGANLGQLGANLGQLDAPRPGQNLKKQIKTNGFSMFL